MNYSKIQISRDISESSSSGRSFSQLKTISLVFSGLYLFSAELCGAWSVNSPPLSAACAGLQPQRWTSSHRKEQLKQDFFPKPSVRPRSQVRAAAERALSPLWLFCGPQGVGSDVGDAEQSFGPCTRSNPALQGPTCDICLQTQKNRAQVVPGTTWFGY